MLQHEDDQKLLSEIAQGNIKLITTSGGVVEPDAADSQAFSTTKNYVPTMHEGDWKDMTQDQNKIQDEIDDRRFP